MMPNVTNKAEMSTRNDRLISEMIRGSPKIELAKTCKVDVPGTFKDEQLDPTQQTVEDNKTEIYGEFKPHTTLSAGNDLATYMENYPETGRRTIIIRVDDNE